MEDYKEKYEMALEGIQEILSSGEDSIKMSRLQLRLQGIFPELKESKDEKIRKAFIKYCKLQQKANNIGFCGISLIDAIAWLEKQGEQPSAIRWYDVSLIPQEMEELLVEWDSEDATWHEIAFYHADTKTFWNGTRQVENVTRWCYIIDLLEKQGKQKPFDYENANIQQKDFAPINVTDEGIVEAIKNTSVLDMIEQKQEWSEEDDYNLQCMIAKVTYDIQKGNVGRNNELIDWLKSLKDRVKGKED